MNPRLDKAFYTRTDVVQVAKDLLGKVLVSQLDGLKTSGIIIETEAYRGPDDKACHAYNNRRTARTEVMFAEGGVAYVYLCYGLHHLFNVVTAEKDMPHAVLIRAIAPLDGIETMLERRELKAKKPNLSAGPGTLSKALGIDTSHTNHSVSDANSLIWIEDHNIEVSEQQIIASPRVGVDYAGDHALWPWRFRLVR